MKYSISWWLYRKWWNIYLGFYFLVRAAVQRGMYRIFIYFVGEEENPLRIWPFEYNGFMGQVFKEKPTQAGMFLEKTSDPGIIKVLVEDVGVRSVPTFAVENDWALPKLKWESCFKKGTTSVLFGSRSSL